MISSNTAPQKAPKKVVLAYSGGLDTSIILKWLQTEYGCEVITLPPIWVRAKNWTRPRQGRDAGHQA